MDEIKEMLKAVINGQHALRGEFSGEISLLRKELKQEIQELRQEMQGLRQEMKNGFVEVNERLDKQGKQLAYLEDDTPTREEHELLKKRVKKVETSLPL